MAETGAPGDGVPAAAPDAAVRPGSRLVPRLLREVMFRRYWSAQTVSLLGDQISLLAIPLLAILAFDAGPADMGLLTAAELTPNLLFSLLAGAWVDRRRHKRRVMIAADLGRAALLLAVPLLWWAGGLTLPLLYIAAFGVGTLGVLFEVAHGSLFASLVGRSDYVDANALTNGSRALSYVAGPSVGGLLVQVLGAPVALLADVASYLGSSVFLARTRVDEPAPEPHRGLGIGAGVRTILRSAILRSTLAAAVTVNLFSYMVSALFVLFATVELGFTPAALGLVLGSGAVGGLLGAVLAGPLSRRIGVGPTVVVGYILFPAPVLLVPLAGQPHALAAALLVAAEFLSSIGVMLLDISSVSLQTAATPPSMLALVQGARRTVNYGIRPIGALIGGALGAAIGVRPTLWIGAAGGLLAVIWLLFSPIPRMRVLPDLEAAPTEVPASPAR